MKKIGWTIIIVVLVGALGIFLYFNEGAIKKEEAVDEGKLYDLTLEDREIIKAIKYDRDKFDALVGDLQAIPKALIDLNAKIIKISYKLEDKGKVAISDEDLKLLGSVQRSYYSKDLLEENPEKEYYKNLIADVRKANEEGVFIIDYKIKEPIIITGDESVVNVRYTLNTRGDDDKFYQQYLLKEEDDSWYIEGWRDISEFEYEKNE